MPVSGRSNSKLDWVEHRLEDVEAQLHLAPVLAAVRASEVGLLHLFAHKADATALNDADARKWSHKSPFGG